MDDLPIRLEQFRNAFRPAGGTHGQQIGEESYALRCNGRALSVLAEAADEITRLRAELAEAKKFKDGMLDVLGGACPNDHRSTPFEEFKGCTPCLRAELAEYRQDAKRYRWLRYPRMGWDIVRKTDGELLCAEYLDGIELDAAIDASRKGEGG